MDKKNEITLSIFVPIYNAEKYLRDCIDSILNQNFQNFELVLYDDGSADLSFSICEEYKEKDSRIILWHDTNGKSIVKMNEFLQKARGRFIGFVDNDDVIEPDFFENIINALNNSKADVCITSYKIIDSNGQVLQFDSPQLEDGLILEKKEVLQQFLTTLNIEGFRWNKVFKREIFLKTGFLFEDKYPTDIRGEVVLLKNINTAVLQSQSGYLYRQHEASSVAQKSITQLEGFLDAFYYVYECMKDSSLNKEGEYYFIWRSINILFGSLREKDKYNKKDWRLFKKGFRISKYLKKGLWSSLICLNRGYESTIKQFKFSVKALIVYFYFR